MHGLSSAERPITTEPRQPPRGAKELLECKPCRQRRLSFPTHRNQEGRGPQGIGPTRDRRVKVRRRQLLAPCLDRRAFLVTAGMTGIANHRHDPAGLKHAEGRVQGRQRPGGPGDHRVIAPGKIAEIEHHRRRTARGRMLRQFDMRTVDKVNPARQIRHPRPRRGDRLRLDVEGQHFPGVPHPLREEHRVVTVARRRINGEIARSQHRGHLMVSLLGRSKRRGHETKTTQLLGANKEKVSRTAA